MRFPDVWKLGFRVRDEARIRMTGMKGGYNNFEITRCLDDCRGSVTHSTAGERVDHDHQLHKVSDNVLLNPQFMG